MKIEFRGKDIKTGEWRYGNIIHSLDTIDDFDSIIIPKTNNNMFASSDENSDLGFEGWYKVDPKTVGQYTNLNDKNGKKIFDGDRCWNDYEEDYGIVSFDEGKFIFTFDNVYVDLFEVADDLEVVGNIHDNPELLEVSE